MDDYERRQALMAKLRDRRCKGNGAELARKLGRSNEYVNKIFYPRTKAQAKGIGQAIMDAARKAFDLPPGFWDMLPDDVLLEDDPTPPGAAPRRNVVPISNGRWADVMVTFWRAAKPLPPGSRKVVLGHVENLVMADFDERAARRAAEAIDQALDHPTPADAESANG